MAADPKSPAFRQSLQRIAATRDGDVLFQWLNDRRVESHGRLAKTAEEVQMLRAQGEYNLLRELLGHDNLDDHRPK